MVLAFTLTGGNVNRYFEAVLGLTISTTTVCTCSSSQRSCACATSAQTWCGPTGCGWHGSGLDLSALTTLWALLATVALIWPGFGVDWFVLHANPNAALTALSFSHERFQNEISQLYRSSCCRYRCVFYLVGPERASRLCRVARIGRDALEEGIVGLWRDSVRRGAMGAAR